MAALRNLRNIFLAKVNEEAEGKILYYLSNRNAVEKRLVTQIHFLQHCVAKFGCNYV